MPKKATKPIPEGMHTLTTSFHFNGDCKKAIDFYQRAFGAELIGKPVPAPDGKSIWHSMLRLGDSRLLASDVRQTPGSPMAESGPKGTTTASLWVYVEDCDQLFKRAVNAGCEILMPMEDMFWGDRMGKLRDPYGHVWTIATLKWQYSEDEMKQGMAEAAKKMK